MSLNYLFLPNIVNSYTTLSDISSNLHKTAKVAAMKGSLAMIQYRVRNYWCLIGLLPKIELTSDVLLPVYLSP